jgi:hypothetical protein
MDGKLHETAGICHAARGASGDDEIFPLSVLGRVDEACPAHGAGGGGSPIAVGKVVRRKQI